MGGQSSKIIFSGVMSNLLQGDVPPTDYDFWDELWKCSLTVDEIFELISVEDVKKLFKSRPGNLKTIFTQAVAQLYQVVETPYPVYFDQALSCARILVRVLPLMIENEKDAKFIYDLFWNKQVAKKKAVEGDASDETSEPLAVVLINSLFHLLFLPDFTIEDPGREFGDEEVNSADFKSALMWAPGVGSTEKSIVHSTQFDKNRIDILRLMIVAFSGPLYQSPEAYDPCSSLWLEVATSADTPYAEIVFYSLMNTVLGYDPVGWGLPYSGLVSADTARPLMETAAQVLVVLLDYGHPIRVEPAQEPGALPSVYLNDTDAPGYNIFRRILHSLEDPDQLHFIYKGFVRLLNNAHQSVSSYLPYSVPRINAEQELLILLWKCLDEIPKFMPFVSRHCDVTEVLLPICYFLVEGRKDPSKVGLMYLCTFMLLKFSGERNFGVALNTPFTTRLPIDIPGFTGNYADLLVIVLHKMIVSGIDKLSALYNCFLTIICNISPYCKAFGTVAAVKLVNLFQLFTSPRFLYASEGNHVYVSMLLETFNNIIQYQYEGNYNIVYAIMRRRELFEALAALTLPAATQSAQAVAEGAGGPAAGKKAAKTKRGSATSASETTETAAEAEPQERPRRGAKFVPNQAWLTAVKAELPLNTIVRLLRHLTPQVDEMFAIEAAVDEKKVLDFIRSTTMVGLLPVPHPIVIRKYQPNKYTCLWFTAFQWGVVYMHNQEVPVFDGRKVKLFMVETV